MKLSLSEASPSVLDPNPDSMGSLNPDLDPRGQKWPNKNAKQSFEVLDVLL
jgi:hypothetical protein